MAENGLLLEKIFSPTKGNVVTQMFFMLFKLYIIIP